VLEELAFHLAAVVGRWRERLAGHEAETAGRGEAFGPSPLDNEAEEPGLASKAEPRLRCQGGTRNFLATWSAPIGQCWRVPSSWPACKLSAADTDRFSCQKAARQRPPPTRRRAVCMPRTADV